MAEFYRAGDIVTVLEGRDAGLTREITVVRAFATDCGYYLRGGGGLYPPNMVELTQERTGGNPCGAACSERLHADLGCCDHCLGQCMCALRGSTTFPC